MTTTRKTCSLLFLLRGQDHDQEILLAMKKRGFGSGRYNGVGGKVDSDETMEQAMVRECQEEICVTPIHYHKVAVHEFRFPDGIADIHVEAFVCDQWEGDPSETEEMAPEWFKTSEIPYDEMWQDDIIWLPLMLRGKLLRTQFGFDAAENMVSAQLNIVDAL